MIDVHLHGALKELLPEPGPLRLAVATPAEALRACQALLPGFRQRLLAGHWTLESAGEPLGAGVLGMRFGARTDLHVLPAAAGGGLEWWILAGAGLLAAGAVVFALMPDLGDYGEGEEADRRQSFLFKGAVNSTAQGGCVPLVYGGPIRVGSILAGAGVWAERPEWPASHYADAGARLFGGGYGAPSFPQTVWRSGAGDPSDSLGADGELYFRTGDATVWRKAGGSWAEIGSAGDGTAAWHVGPSAPAASLGAAGDWYLMTLFFGYVYEKTGGGWQFRRPAILAGAGKGDAPRRPVEADDTLETTSTLRAVDVICEGPIAGLANGLQSVFVDGTPVAATDGAPNLEGVSIDFRVGLPEPKPPGPGFDKGTSETVQVGVTVSKANNPSGVARTIQQPCDAARVRLRFPLLQRRIVDSAASNYGDILPTQLRFRIYARSRGGAKELRHDVVLNDKASAPAEIHWDVELDPPAAGAGAAHTIWVRRMTDDHVSANDGYSDLLEWVGLDTVRHVAQTYPHTAMAYITAEAEKFTEGNVHKREYEIYGRIVRVPSNYDPAARAYAGLWDGTFILSWTDNPAWCLLDLLSHPRYGLGRELGADGASLGDLEAAKWDLYALAQWCDQPVPDGVGGTEPRWRLTCAITKAAEAKRLLDSMLSACRAALHHGPGGLAVTFDRPEDPVLLVGDANAVDGEMRYEDAVGDRDRHSAVAVTFNDPSDGWRRGVELVVDDALVERHGYRRADKAAFGAASRGQAHRLGRHHLYAQEHESEALRWRAGLDAASLRPGDVVRQTDSRRAGERHAVRLRGPEAGDGPWDAPVGTEGVIGRALNVVGAYNSGGARLYINPSIAVPASAVAEGRASTLSRLVYGSTNVQRQHQFFSLGLEGWGVGPDFAADLEPWVIVGLRWAGTARTYWLLVRDDDDAEPYVWKPPKAAALESFLGLPPPGGAESHFRIDVLLLDGRKRDMESPLDSGHYPHDRLARLRCDAPPPYGAGGWTANVVLPDGTVERRTVSRFDGADLILSAPLSAPPRPNAMCVLEGAGKEARLWRVASVAERGPLDYEVRAFAHDPARYAAVEGGLNLLSPDLTDLEGGPLAAPDSVALSEELRSDGREQRTVLVVSVARSEDPRVALAPSVDVQVRPPGESEWRPLGFGGFRHELRNAERGGSYRARARYLLAAGAVRSPWTESADLTVTGYALLPAPDGLSATALDGGYAAEWSFPASMLNYGHTEVLDGPPTAASPSAATLRAEVRGTFFPRAAGLPANALKVWARHVDVDGRPGDAASVEVTPLDLPHPDVAVWMEMDYDASNRYIFNRDGGAFALRVSSTSWTGIRDRAGAVTITGYTNNIGPQFPYRNSIRAGDTLVYLERGVTVRWVAWEVTAVAVLTAARKFSLRRLSYSDGGSSADDDAQASIWFGCSAPSAVRGGAQAPAFTLSVSGMRFVPSGFGRSGEWLVMDDNALMEWRVNVDVTAGVPNFNVTVTNARAQSNLPLGRAAFNLSVNDAFGRAPHTFAGTVTVTQPFDGQTTQAAYAVTLEVIHRAAAAQPPTPSSGAKGAVPAEWSVARGAVALNQRRYMSYRMGHCIGDAAVAANWVMGHWSRPQIQQYKQTSVVNAAAPDTNSSQYWDLPYDDDATDRPPSFRQGQYHFNSYPINNPDAAHTPIDRPTWNQVKSASQVRISSTDEAAVSQNGRLKHVAVNDRIAFRISSGQWVQWRVSGVGLANALGVTTSDPDSAARFKFDLDRTSRVVEEAGGTNAPSDATIHFRIARAGS